MGKTLILNCGMYSQADDGIWPDPLHNRVWPARLGWLQRQF